VKGDESVGEAQESRRGAWRTSVRRYRDDLVYGANDGIFTTFSHRRCRQQRRQPPQLHWSDLAAFGGPAEPLASRVAHPTLIAKARIKHPAWRPFGSRPTRWRAAPHPKP
jgi:hypothetical protein